MKPRPLRTPAARSAVARRLRRGQRAHLPHPRYRRQAAAARAQSTSPAARRRSMRTRSEALRTHRQRPGRQSRTSSTSPAMPTRTAPAPKNRALAEQRAKAVRDALVATGVPARTPAPGRARQHRRRQPIRRRRVASSIAFAAEPLDVLALLHRAAGLCGRRFDRSSCWPGWSRCGRCRSSSTRRSCRCR